METRPDANKLRSGIMGIFRRCRGISNNFCAFHSKRLETDVLCQRTDLIYSWGYHILMQVRKGSTKKFKFQIFRKFRNFHSVRQLMS